MRTIQTRAAGFGMTNRSRGSAAISVKGQKNQENRRPQPSAMKSPMQPWDDGRPILRMSLVLCTWAPVYRKLKRAHSK